MEVVVDISNTQINGLCPNCGSAFPLVSGIKTCPACEYTVYLSGAGFLLSDLSDKEEERQFYDLTYETTGNESSYRNLDELQSEWIRPDQPQNSLVRHHLGDIEGKVVLMLGNGASSKELAFLKEGPAKLIYSDLSINASRRLRNEYDLSMFEDCLITASVDAESLPFEDQAIDIVYAYAMVHHLPNLELFFAEVARVLRPGGKAIFMDDASSGPWNWAKFGPLKSLMLRSHKKSGISPEDYRFSMSGGFKETELAGQIESVGGAPFFERTSFVNYILCRGAMKLLPNRLSWIIRRGVAARFANTLDRCLARYKFYRGWQIRLVWGFSKR